MRSDERIRELVCDDLMDNPLGRRLGASRSRSRTARSTLSGKVESRDAKHWAEGMAEHAGGVKHVQNNLRVVDKPASD